jgi:hypothetical protein
MSYLWNTEDQTQQLLVHQPQTGEYAYWVQVTDTNSCASGDTILITVTPGVPLPESPITAVLKVFPNPTTGWLYLLPDTDQADVKIGIYDMKGSLVMRKVLQLKAGEISQMNVSGLHPGVYQLKINEKLIRIIKK